MNLPDYNHALERSDLKRHPLEIGKVPNRGADAPTALERESSFSEIAAEVEAEKPGQPVVPSRTSDAKAVKPFAFWQDGDFSFGDFLDIINPLQHVPIVATLYRNMSGDKIGAASRVIGGALWGRIGGLVSGVVNVVVDWFTGKDIGDHIYAALFGNTGPSSNATIVAQPSKLEKLPSDQAAVQEAPAETSFADEDRYSEFLGRYKDAPASPTAQVAQPQTPVTPVHISAVSSYEQNAAVDLPMVDSKLRFFA